MKLIIDSITKKVVGMNRNKRPLEISIDIPTNSILKTIDNKIYNITEQPDLFTFDDLIEIKGKNILNKTMRKYIILNEELKEEDLSLNLSTHSANTGFKFLQINPNGQCRTNKINLPIPTSTIGLYIEAQDGIITEISSSASNFQEIKNYQFINLGEYTNSVYLRFKNTTNEPKEITSYGIIF